MNHISQHGLTLIEGYEGFRSCPYGPPADVWTIGYGETRGVNAKTPCVSREQAEKKLRRRIRRDYEPYIHRLGLRLNQNQFDALVSCIYNLGPGILDRGRSLGDALREKPLKISDVQAAIRLYDMPGTIFHEGLQKRREAEAQLFAKHAPLTKRQKRLRRLRRELARVNLALRETRKHKAEIEAAIRRTKETAKNAKKSNGK